MNHVIRIERHDLTRPGCWQPRFCNRDGKLVEKKPFGPFHKVEYAKEDLGEIRGANGEVQIPFIKKGEVRGWEYTVLDELRNRFMEYGNPGWSRIDILLINRDADPRSCPTCFREGYVEHLGQWTVEPGVNGTLVVPSHGSMPQEVIDSITPEDRAWAEAESRKCWETALKEPLFMWRITEKCPPGFNLEKWKVEQFLGFFGVSGNGKA